MQDLLIYYGWLNSFNSAQHGWDNDNVSIELANYDVLVLGAGLQDPAHGDYANTQYIITKIKTLDPTTKIFGYVTVNQDLATFRTKVEQWEDLAVDGIFMDEAGYDYGKNRDELNERIAFVHSQVTAKLCFVNAWNPHHVLTRENDANFPNITFNANDNESLLSNNDWYLMESLLVNTDSYLPDGFNTFAQWRDRKAVLDQATQTRDINVAACGIINDDDQFGQAKFYVFQSCAYMHNVDAMGTSDTSYGAGTAKSKKWNRSNL